MSQAKYMVSVTGSNAPSNIHTDWQQAKAKAEAERLSKLSQNRDRTIHVVQVMATLKPVTTHVWEQ